MDLTSSSDDDNACPISYDCEDHKNLVSFDLGQVPSYVSITSSSLSCLGSLLILYAYFTLKDIRSGAQKVITLLAIADFFTASGYIVGSVNFLTHFNHTDTTGCRVFNEICEVQSFVTTWSTMCSYSWTCILAFYFFLVLVFNRSQLAACLLPLYNVLAWIGPLLIVLPLLATKQLGFAPYVASDWCYIKAKGDKKLIHQPHTIIFLFLAGKFWEILSYIFVIVIYVWIKVYLSKSKKAMRENGESSQSPAVVGRVEMRLLGIPLLYILLRMWGTLQFFYSLIVAHTNENGCIPQEVRTIYLIFAFLQAIGDGGQGWGNALLYIFLSPSIRKRLFGEPFNKCLLATEEKFQALLETDTMTSERSIQASGRNDKVSLVATSEVEERESLTGGEPATGYGVRSLGKDTPTTNTSYTASNTHLTLSHSITPRNVVQT